MSQIPKMLFKSNERIFTVDEFKELRSVSIWLIKGVTFVTILLNSRKIKCHEWEKLVQIVF